MKINVNQLSSDGIPITEEIAPGQLDVEIEGIRFAGPVKVFAVASRITNAVTVEVSVQARFSLQCSRCVTDFEEDFNREFLFNYLVEKNEMFIDLNPDIRAELILEYPIKSLCSSDCKGLCLQCGKNLNEGGCSCGST